MTTYVDNYRKQIDRADGARFMIEQRNVGFEPNDSQWVVEQLPELYWSPNGVLRYRRKGAFLGVFADRAAVDVVITTAELRPIDDEMVM